MPLLNAADAIYLGDRAVDRVYLGAVQVWPAIGGGGEEVRFGREATGSDTFPLSDDRALASPFVLGTSIASLSSIVGLFSAASTAGASGRAFIATDAAGAPGSILAISASVAIPAGGGWVTFPVTHGTLAAGTYWLGIVGSEFQASWSHATGTPGATMVMANGTFSFTTPPATWPGNSASYGSQLCVYAIGST